MKQLSLLTIMAFMALQSLAENKQKLDEVVIRGQQKFVYTYNETGKCTSKAEYKWDEAKSDWSISDKTSYTFPEAGKKILVKQEKEGEKLVKTYKSKAIYNNQGEKTETKSYRWNPESNTWENYHHKFIHYSDNGKITQRIDKIWDKEIQQYKNSIRERFTYQPQEKKKTKYIDNWNTEAKSWQPSQKTIYQYRQDDQLAKKVSQYVVSFGEKKGEWMGRSKVTYTYDQQGNPMEEIHYRMNFSKEKWELSRKKVHQYNKAGLAEKLIIYNAEEDGKWKAFRKSHFTYNQENNSKQLVLPFNEEDGEGNPFQVSLEQAPVKTVEMQARDYDTGEWKNRGKMEFKWSSL